MSEIRIDKIQNVPISELVENPKNRNKHPEKQIKRLAKIIEYQGFRQPVTVSNRSGYVVAGHGRLAAARLLGLTEVPVSFQDFDSEDQEIAYGVSDNAIAEWAELDFSGINADLADFDPSFELDHLGIDGFKLEVAEKIDAPAEQTRETLVQAGDLWQLGEHQLVVGDTELPTVSEMVRLFEKETGTPAELKNRITISD